MYSCLAPAFPFWGRLEPPGCVTVAQKHPWKYWLVVCGDERTLIEQVTSEKWGLVSQVPFIASELGRKETIEARLP